MSFAISKVLWALTAPDTILLICLVGGLGLLQMADGRPAKQAGRALAAGATFGFVVLAVLPIGPWMMRALEDRFPVMGEPPADIAGIIVLGGAVTPLVSAERGKPALNEAAERMTVLPVLAARFPHAKLVFSGGSGLVLDQDAKEAPVAATLWAELGMDTGRIVFETDSRNTWENAVRTRELLSPPDGSRWLLVTSAAHMPRAVGVFRRVGWTVVPYPVDFTIPERHLRRFGPGFAPGLMLARQAFREYLGLVAYRIMGRTDRLFPRPERVP